MTNSKRAYTRRSLDAEAGGNDETVLPAAGPLPQRGGRVEVEAVLNNEKAANLAFLNEPIDILLHESTDPNAERVVTVGVNGKMIHLPRGKAVTIPRRYVAVLASARPVSVRTREVLDANGDRTTAVSRSSALGYPFSVVNDPNPQGVAWLKRVLAQAA